MSGTDLFPTTAEPGDFSVAVIDSDQRFRTRLAAQLGDHLPAASFPSITALEERVPAGTGIVVILGPSNADAIGLYETERLLRGRPELAGIMVVEALSTDVLQQALRAGVHDVLAAPVDDDQLVAAVDRVTASLAAAPEDRDPDGTAQDHPRRARVITVFSPKGGAGRSVIASSLAVVLAKRSTRPVVLVDADLQFGDIAVMLKLAPQRTIADAVNAGDRLDTQLLQSLLVRHEPSGLLVLAAPLEPAFADRVGTAEMSRIMALLRDMAELVVVDTPAYLNEVVLGLIENSDDVVVVAGMDIPNIKNVKIGLQTLRMLDIPVSKLKLVLNRANSKVKLDVNEVERTLGIKADSLIPSDVVVPQSVNKGAPVVLDAPKSGVARALEQLASLFVAVDVKKRRS